MGIGGWSSDVCSTDLLPGKIEPGSEAARLQIDDRVADNDEGDGRERAQQDQLLVERNAPSAGLPRAGRANPAGALALVHQVCSSGRHRINAGVSAVSPANGRSIAQAALRPPRVQPTTELHWHAPPATALDDPPILHAGGDHP